jgi:hypothetical protein
VGGIKIVSILPPAYKIKLLVGRQNGEPLDLSEITGKVPLRC